MSLVPIAAAVGGTIVKALVKNGKRKSTIALVRPAKRRKKNQNVATLSNRRVLTQGITPQALGFVSRNIVNGDSMPYTFDAHNIYLVTDASTPPNLIMTTATGSALSSIMATSGIYAYLSTYDLHPAGNNYSQQIGPLGPSAISLATAFMRWRLEDLTMQYLPSVSTGTSGSVALGYRNDPFTYLTSGSVSMPFSIIAGSRNSVVGSANGLVMSGDNIRFFGFRCQNLDTDPKWVFHQNDANQSQRLQFAGQMTCAGIGLSPGTFYGILRLSGRIRFWDVGSQFNNTTDPTVGNTAEVTPTAVPVSSSIALPCSTIWDSNGDGDGLVAPNYWFGTTAGAYTPVSAPLFSVDPSTQTITFNEIGHWDVKFIAGIFTPSTDTFNGDPYVGGGSTATINTQASGEAGDTAYSLNLLSVDTTTTAVGQTLVYFGPASSTYSANMPFQIRVFRID